MKVSLNFMQNLSPVKLAPHGIDEMVEKIGSQLGAVEEVIDLSTKYQGIVVAKVVSCEKHPNADKLKICLIDDGKAVKGVKRNAKGLVQVVCGAPNVEAGMLVAWLPPGVTVPATLDKEPLVLEAREIRGQMSNGMLASAHELGISEDHSGILEIDEDAKPGQAFMYVYGLNDSIIDIENKMFTHRPDCFGHLGVAREVAGITHQQFKSPDWYIKENSFTSYNDPEIKGLEVDNQIPELCPRYMAVVLSGVHVGPSPIWLQTYLSRVGVRPINNVVDMTNYMMLLTAQPLHAFDFDKVAKNGRAKIVVRKPKKGEQLTLLDGKTITPRSEAVLICNQDKPIALGGVMGGKDTEVDENTSRIIIECANFDLYNIRRTAMEHGIFTEAVTRFNKGQSPLQCPPVLYKAVQMVQELCSHAQPIGKVVDAHKTLHFSEPVKVSAQFINERLGLELSANEMAKLLKNVEFQVRIASEKLTIVPPFWRTDIHIPEDVVEEVGRLYGYDKLPLTLPKRDLKPAHIDPLLAFKSRLRDILSDAGANEILTYTFVNGDLLKKVGQDTNNAFKLANALSPNLHYYRLSLLPSLLEKVHPNLKAGHEQFALYEINQTHGKDLVAKDGLPIEEYRLGLVFAADDKTAKTQFEGAPFFQARRYVSHVLDSLGIYAVFETSENHRLQGQISKDTFAPFDKARTAIVKTADGRFLGEIGEFRTEVKQSLKLPSFVAGFELDVEALFKAQNSGSPYVPLPRYPSLSQDLTLKVPSKHTYQEVYDLLTASIQKLNSADTYSELLPLDIYQPPKDTAHRHFTFRLSIANYERTLTDKEVNDLLQKVADIAKEQLQATRL